jgi:hypothetical protein
MVDHTPFGKGNPSSAYNVLKITFMETLYTNGIRISMPNLVILQKTAKSAEILGVFRAFLTQDGGNRCPFQAVLPYVALPKKRQSPKRLCRFVIDFLSIL